MTLLSRHLCTRIVHKALSVVRPVFRLDLDDGVHGVGHWSRVWFHGRHLAESVDVNPAILAWFAYLHDSQRHNDHRDPQHGTRAADFALNLKKDRVITDVSGIPIIPTRGNRIFPTHHRQGGNDGSGSDRPTQEF